MGSLLRYLSLKASWLVNLTDVSVGVLWRQVSRSAGFYSSQVRHNQKGHCRGEMHEPSELCVEEREIALFTAVLPQVKYNSTKMIEENTPGRSKSGMTGIFVELDTFCPCWSREVCVRRP